MVRTIEDRNNLFEQHIKLAKNLAAKRYATVNRAVQYDELLSAAYVGLLDAAKKYDSTLINPKCSKPFECYARRRIKGEMLDYLRSCNWGSRKNPQYMASIEKEVYSSDSSENTIKIGDLCTSRDKDVVDDLNIKELFTKLVRCLPKRDRIVFTLRYMFDLTMKEIAENLAISESRVSQILSRNVDYLRSVWREHKQDLLLEIECSVKG